MSLTVAELSFIFGADTREVDRALHSVGRDVDRTASRGTRVMGNFWRAAGVGAAAFAGGAAVFLKGAITEASDLGESVNAVNVTFGKAAKGIKRLGKDAADSVGLSKTEFSGLSVQFSNFVNTVSGGKARAVVRTMDDLTTRAADFASVMNMDVAEAATLFQSGLAGETEPLRRYGIDLSAAAVQAHAYKTGLAEAGAELTEQQKVQSRYSLLMQQTSKTAGDFENTQDSLANVMRRLGAHFDNSQAKLGKGFLPALESAGKYLIDEGIPALNRFSDWFNDKGIPAIQDFAGWVMDDAVPAVKDFAGFLGDAMGHAKDLVGWLNDLPKPAKYAGLAALLGVGVGAKVRGGNDGALGTAGKVLGLTKGTPVYVTNWAQIATGGGSAPSGGKPGILATAGKFAGPVGLAAAAAYSIYKMPEIWNFGANKLGEALGLDKKPSKPERGAAGSREHDTILRNWEGAEGAVTDYNKKLERTRDHLLTITNGVTGFASEGERAKDKVLAITNGIVGTGREIDRAKSKAALLRGEFDKIDGRVVTTYFNAVNSKAAAGGIPLEQLVGRHAGGPTNAGQWYIVGEKGPELFQAGVQGRVYSNRDSASMMSGGATNGGVPAIDYDRLARATAAVVGQLQRPLYGDVHISGDPTVFRREMDRDAHAAAYSGMPV